MAETLPSQASDDQSSNGSTQYLILSTDLCPTQVCDNLGGRLTVVANSSENSEYTAWLAQLMDENIEAGCSFSSVGENLGPTFHLGQAKEPGDLENSPVR